MAVITVKRAGAAVKGSVNLLCVEDAGEGEVWGAAHLGEEVTAQGTMSLTEAHRRSLQVLSLKRRLQLLLLHSHSACVLC